MFASGNRHNTRPAADGRRTRCGVGNGHAENVGVATNHRLIREL